MLCSGLPLFFREDANRDARVTLQDAILHLQNLSRTVEHPLGFKESFKNAARTFKLLAGLDRIIKNDPNAGSTLIFYKLPFLLPSNQISLPLNFGWLAGEPEVLHESVDLAPVSPPPELPAANIASCIRRLPKPYLISRS